MYKVNEGENDISITQYDITYLYYCKKKKNNIYKLNDKAQ